MKTVKEIARDMAYYSKGNLHDIDHFLRVWGYARDIADGECLSKRERYVLEVAAITHDIACPLCREKYGNTDGKNQEREGAVLVRTFLRDAGIPDDLLESTAQTIRSSSRPTTLQTRSKITRRPRPRDRRLSLSFAPRAASKRQRLCCTSRPILNFSYILHRERAFSPAFPYKTAAPNHYL